MDIEKRFRESFKAENEKPKTRDCWPEIVLISSLAFIVGFVLGG